MGVLSQLDQRRIQANPWTDDRLWTSTGGYTLQTTPPAAGVHVTEDRVQQIAAAQACIRVLAEAIAYLPLQIFEWINGEDRQLARSHPLYEKLAHQPNDWQTSFEWREMMMGHALLRPAAYNRILFSPDGEIDQLIPLHPD